MAGNFRSAAELIGNTPLPDSGDRYYSTPLFGD